MAQFEHRNESAPVLGQLNSGGTRLVENALSVEIKKSRDAGGSEPICVLDIGCGASPYLLSLPPEGLSITFVDKDKETIEKHWIKDRPKSASSLSCRDFLKGDLYDLKPEDHHYDIVILAFVLHELRAQLALQTLDYKAEGTKEVEHSDPAETILKRLATAPFIRQDTIIILSDVFHWPYWDAKILDEARRLQFEQLGHADPASAFLLGAEVLRYAACANLELINYEVAASVDINAIPSDPLNSLRFLCTHPKYGNIFRSRRAFCAILKRKPQSNTTATQNPADTAFSKCYGGLSQVVREGMAGDKELQKKNHDYLHRLRELLDGSAPVEVSDYDTLLGRGLFSSLAQSAGEVTQDWFATTQVTSPTALSFWFSMNSLVLEDTRRETRYALKDGKVWQERWQCHHVHLGGSAPVSVEIGYEQDWPLLCFNHFSSPDTVKYLSGSNNWLADLSPPSVYRWMTSGSMQHPAWRSVSIVCPLEGDSHSSETPAHLVEDALILQKYRRPSTSLEGHLLLALPGHEKVAHSLGTYLDKMCYGHYCSENPESSSLTEKARTAVLHAMSAVYLDSMFLARGHTSDRPPNIEHLLRGFEERWLSSPQVRFFGKATDAEEIVRCSAENLIPLPERMRDQITRFIERVREKSPDVRKLPVVWTCFIVKQPGSDKSPIATVMFISDRPFDPALLELFKAQFQEIFFSIREVESGRIVRLLTKSRTVQTMLRSFGHDGRRYATGITSALGKTSNIGDLTTDERMAIGRWLAQNLASRLYVYQTLIGDEKITSSDYKDESNRVTNSVYLADLVRREVAVLLLRSAVEESEFQILAERLGLAHVKTHLVKFAMNALNKATPFPSDSLKELEESVRDIIKMSWDGFDRVRIPTDLNAEGNRTPVSRISVGLGFILSELLTNVFRHQFSQIDDLQAKLPVHLAFSLRQGDNGYDLDIRTKPSFKPATKLAKPNPTGLASLEFIASALQVCIPSESLQAGSNRVYLPFPTFNNSTGELVSSVQNISPDALLLES